MDLVVLVIVLAFVSPVGSILVVRRKQSDIAEFVAVNVPCITLQFDRYLIIPILNLRLHNPVFQLGSICFFLLNNTGRQVFKYPLPSLYLIDRRRQCLFEFIAFAKQLLEILFA